MKKRGTLKADMILPLVKSGNSDPLMLQFKSRAGEMLPLAIGAVRYVFPV